MNCTSIIIFINDDEYYDVKETLPYSLWYTYIHIDPPIIE